MRCFQFELSHDLFASSKARADNWQSTLAMLKLSQCTASSAWCCDLLFLQKWQWSKHPESWTKQWESTVELQLAQVLPKISHSFAHNFYRLRFAKCNSSQSVQTCWSFNRLFLAACCCLLTKFFNSQKLVLSDVADEWKVCWVGKGDHTGVENHSDFFHWPLAGLPSLQGIIDFGATKKLKRQLKFWICLVLSKKGEWWWTCCGVTVFEQFFRWTFCSCATQKSWNLKTWCKLDPIAPHWDDPLEPLKACAAILFSRTCWAFSHILQHCVPEPKIEWQKANTVLLSSLSQSQKINSPGCMWEPLCGTSETLIAQVCHVWSVDLHFDCKETEILLVEQRKKGCLLTFWRFIVTAFQFSMFMHCCEGCEHHHCPTLWSCNCLMWIRSVLCCICFNFVRFPSVSRFFIVAFNAASWSFGNKLITSTLVWDCKPSKMHWDFCWRHTYSSSQLGCKLIIILMVSNTFIHDLTNDG